jgi:hypothetical protein
MECHCCPHHEDVESGKYREVPFETTPCASCELDDEPDFVVAYDDERPGAAPGAPGIQPDDAEDALFPEELDAEPERSVQESLLWDLVVTLLKLHPRTRDVVCWRFAGFRYKDIAMLQHVSVPAVELRHRNAVKQYPLLRSLFPTKVGKRRCRVRHAHAGAEGRS